MFSITKDNYTVCEIVISKKPDGETEHVAAVLKKILESITKRNIPVVREGAQSVE